MRLVILLAWLGFAFGLLGLLNSMLKVGFLLLLAALWVSLYWAHIMRLCGASCTIIVKEEGKKGAVY